MSANTFENKISFKDLLLNSQRSDVNFLFDSPDGIKRVPANKAILSIRSDVFAAMFYGELKEEGDVTVTDTSIDAFKEFLQFFYLNRVELTVENVADVMDLGHKYNVKNCANACVKFLTNVVVNVDVCLSLHIALLHDLPELQKYCETYIALHSKAVLNSKNFLGCDKKVLAHILRMNSLSCCETTVFETCMSWIKTKSKQDMVTKQLIQEHLGELFYEIRFTSMKMEEFKALNAKHDYAFFLAEYNDIVKAIASSTVMSTSFKGNCRQIQWDKHAIKVCDRKTSGSLVSNYSLSKNKPTKFESNQPILLGMLFFAPLAGFSSKHFINVTIIEASPLNNRTLSNFEIPLPSGKRAAITLPAPVLIRPGLIYEIRIDSNNKEMLSYKCGNLMTDVQLEDKWSIKFHDDLGKKANFVTALGVKRV